MKKIILLIVLATTFMAAQAPMSAHAAPIVTPVTIKGSLIKNGLPMPNKMVTFQDNGQTIGTATTDSNGEYTFTTDSNAAPLDSIVTAKADQDNDGILDSAAAAPVKGPVIIIIITGGIINNVPEYGLAGGIAAAALGLGAVMWRRRQIG